MLIASILVGGSIGLLLRRESPQMLANRLVQQFETMPEEDVPAAMEKAAASENVSFPLLAAALSSNRAVVVDEAQRLLDQQLHEIKAKSPDEASAALDKLASALSNNMQNFGPSAKATAQSIAEQLLQWPVDGDEQSRIELVAHCERILRGGEEPSTERKLPTASIGATLPTTDQAAHFSQPSYAQDRSFHTPSMDHSVARYAQAPGGHVPYQTLPMPSVPVLRVPRQNDNGPRPLNEPNNAQPIQPYEGPNRLPLQPPAAPIGIPEEANERTGFTPAKNPTEPQMATAMPPVARPNHDLASMTTLQLVKLLPQVNAAELPPIEQELSRRGFTPADFNLVARFNSANLEDRRSLVSQVASTPTPWALQWLLWLSHDTSPAVRYEAISMLSTARDPAIVQRMNEVVQTEPNPEIVRLAQGYLERLRGR